MLQELGRAIPDFKFSPLDPYTAETIRKMRINAAKHVVSKATKIGKPVPMLIDLQTGFDELSLTHRSRTLAVYDAAGEHFQTLSNLHENVPATTHVEAIWFFVSIIDLEQKPEQFSLMNLFQTYCAAVKDAGQTLRGEEQSS